MLGIETWRKTPDENIEIEDEGTKMEVNILAQNFESSSSTHRKMKSETEIESWQSSFGGANNFWETERMIFNAKSNHLPPHADI